MRIVLVPMGVTQKPQPHVTCFIAAEKFLYAAKIWLSFGKRPDCKGPHCEVVSNVVPMYNVLSIDIYIALLVV